MTQPLERVRVPSAQSETMTDQHGRSINYLRLSITDRCNLRCLYCRSCEGLKMLPHDQMLSYEECLELIAVASTLNISKVRLTGGEPFIRKNFLHFLERILDAHPQLDMRLTTNATLLGGKIPALKKIGIKGLNISLDTLDRAKFQRITGRDFFLPVRGAIDQCLDYGLRIKINVVAMKGINDDELAAFIRLAENQPLDVRFIEFMPVGEKTVWRPDQVWTSREILQQAQEVVQLKPVTESGKRNGPARMFEIVGGKGRIGVISPMSSHFCGQCNRLRITPDGRLRTCLFSDKEYRLRPILRSSKLGREHLRRVIIRAGKIKPMGHEILAAQGRQGSVCRKIMSAIGG
ncbi:cyclic pyranopterin phosphate synthase [Desulfonatronum thiosulfatophilum]|uniref:GTP 3',8-cyclase n=1 Tax=Desulfonatronum thiosulfatophilum TaxID=617002 RepID=A0A1G6DC66_9BACT|nr:GTP 3',8-cyclase MoaA [Desulfonatronum thiosulfatophilum]SDB42744.1 cyclic pyranopterin phosphate synthase [Desulfonatronum thiosulfatophilum]